MFLEVPKIQKAIQPLSPHIPTAVVPRHLVGGMETGCAVCESERSMEAGCAVCKGKRRVEDDLKWAEMIICEKRRTL